MWLITLGMVGTLGNNAIAAVGLSVSGNELVLALVVGLIPAVQGLVARRRGEGSTERESLPPLNSGLLVAVVVGVPLTVICYLLTPFFFSLMSFDPEVLGIGIPFLRTLFITIVAAGMNYAFGGYWAGIQKPKVHMSIVLSIDSLNIVLNYVLIFGKFGAPALGVMGAAVSAMTCVYLGVFVNAALMCFRFRANRGLPAKPESSLLTSIVKLALPASLQSFLMEISYVVFFWMVGRLGTAELAAGNVVIRIAMVFLFLSMSLGSASATLVSRCLGERDFTGAAQWGWDIGKLGVIGISLLGLPLVLFPKPFLSILISDPGTVSICLTPVRLVGVTAGMMSLLYIFGQTLFSVGDGTRVMMVSFCTRWMVFLPGVWLVGPYLHYGLVQIIAVQGISSLLATALVTSFWAGGKWKTITI
jgi:putative MATE family efflux protein